MPQNTLTVNRNRYTGRQIAALADPDEMTNGGDYIITLGDIQLLINFRDYSPTEYFCPVCSRKNANIICVEPRWPGLTGPHAFLWL